MISLDEINQLNKKVAERKVIKQKILQGFRDGKSASELSVELKVSQTTMNRIKKELVKQEML